MNDQQLITKELVEADAAAFELAQRKAAIYAKSDLVPQQYRNNIGNVLIAENMSRRMGADLLMVMQNLFVVHGTPGWSAKFLIGCFNSSGRFSAIKYRFTGERGEQNWGCVAYATELSTGEVVEGTEVTIVMAKAEGWSEKKGSKWLTMPEQMLRYRAATFFIRTTAPEIGMGLMTREEIEDSVIDGAFSPAGRGSKQVRVSALETMTMTPEPPEPTEDNEADSLLENVSRRISEMKTASEVTEFVAKEMNAIAVMEPWSAEVKQRTQDVIETVANARLKAIKAGRGERSNKAELFETAAGIGE